MSASKSPLRASLDAMSKENLIHIIEALLSKETEGEALRVIHDLRESFNTSCSNILHVGSVPVPRETSARCNVGSNHKNTHSKDTRSLESTLVADSTKVKKPPLFEK